MDRRHFLRSGIAGGVSGVVALGAGGVLLVRRNNARAEMNTRLLNDALPPLTSGSLRELQSLPVRCREEIRRFFHGKCLNVASFISHICSDSFRERLGRCNTDNDRHECLLAAFCGRVATEQEILNHVDTIATEVGSELDTAWGGYCRQLSSKWNVSIRGYGSPLNADALTSRVSGIIRTELSQAVQLATTAGQGPALGQSIGNIGKSSVMLLPLVRLGKVGLVIGIPLFVILAGREVWNYVLGRLDDRRGDFQAAISARIALLGNRVGDEFEREVRQRITDLHTWQERSVRDTASQLAQERVSYF